MYSEQAGKGLESQTYGELLCHAYRHRWIPYAGQAGVVGARKVEQWELKCENGCDSSATEWREMDGERVEGTQRQYDLTESYSAGTGHTQGEYITEIRKRQRKQKRRRNA